MCTERTAGAWPRAPRTNTGRRRGVASGIALLAALAALLLGTDTRAQTPEVSTGDAAAALARWLGGDDPILLVLVVDGLRPDRLEADGPWLQPLMPHARGLMDSSLVFGDVISARTEPGSALAALARGLEPLRRAGFATQVLLAPFDLRRDPVVAADAAWLLEGRMPPGEPGPGRSVQGKSANWVALCERELEEMIAAAAAASGPQLVVAVLDHLLPPFDLPPALMQQLDPEPWAGLSETPTRIEEHVQRRLRRVRQLAESPTSPRITGRAPAMREYAWVIDTAHARFDVFLGQLITTLDQPELRTRAGLVLTATSATATGERGLVGSGTGARRDVAHVPLLLRLPDGRSRMRDARPRQLEDLGPTWRRALGLDPARGPNLFDSPTPDRARFTLGSGRAPGTLADQELAEARWVREEFSVVDLVQPVRTRRLHDRWLDPGEHVDRAHLFPSLTDSLTRAMRIDLYGSRPRVHLRARDAAGAVLRLATRGPVAVVGPASGAQVAGQDVLWTIAGPEDELVVELLEGATDLRLRREGAMMAALVLGGVDSGPMVEPVELPLHGALFARALRGPGRAPAASGTPRIELWLETEGRAAGLLWPQAP